MNFDIFQRSASEQMSPFMSAGATVCECQVSRDGLEIITANRFF